MMIDHEPGSDVFTLRWDVATLALGLLSGLAAACVVSLFRWSTSEGPDAVPGGTIVRNMARIVVPGLVAPFGFMVDHVPGSGVFTLRWDGSKLVFSLLGVLISAGVVGLYQWRSRIRSQSHASS